MAYTFLTRIPCSSSMVQVPEHSFLGLMLVKLLTVNVQAVHFLDAPCSVWNWLRPSSLGTATSPLMQPHPSQQSVTFIRKSLTQSSIISTCKEFLTISACHWWTQKTWNIHRNALHYDTLTRILMSVCDFFNFRIAHPSLACKVTDAFSTGTPSSSHAKGQTLAVLLNLRAVGKLHHLQDSSFFNKQ